ncbi:(deoxy)nucleoside triphosphate pyrophosphohydrolase [candidate division KSB1 bacterium]|nr:(deoxy)nucleoside triphosphate pyrophosphohydrolase [candidate division KSB1 bacterium]
MHEKMQRVVAAVIVRDGRVLVAQRGDGKMAGKWEFPGGKVMADELPHAALAREIREELSLLIQVGAKIDDVPFSINGRRYRLIAYYARPVAGTLLLHEHRMARWVRPDELLDLELAPADIPIAEKVAAEMKGIESAPHPRAL